MNKIKITNILSDAIVKFNTDRSQLYQVLSVINSETDTYVIAPADGSGKVVLCTSGELQLEAIATGNKYVDQYGNEVTYDELREQKFA